ncbi:MAG: iron-sulfur cluster assembly accessory protein [Planctomycetota bacterium]|nr:iron-sulfur cluster assembly accessory protein [Planctomycetota bacterium]
MHSQLGAVATATAVAEPPKKADPKPVPAPVAAKPADGEVVALTANAQAEVKRLLALEKPGAGLRLGVKGGGCSGLSYKLEFDQKKEGDLVIAYEGFSVFLDRKSTIYLRGVTLDHQKGLQGKGFVFHNPNATNTCGCGESFSV